MASDNVGLEMAQAEQLQIDNECKEAREKAYMTTRKKIKKVSSSVTLTNKALRKLVENEVKDSLKKELGREISDDDVVAADIDEIISQEFSGKANNKVDIDVREHVIPSKLIEEELMEHISPDQAMIIDEDQFDMKQHTKFSKVKVTEYIDVMIQMFDIDPYYEVERKRKGKNDVVYTEYETIPNDLPLFGEYGFKVGLTPSDIDTLRNRLPRFSHAFDMCKQKQEQILITNMLLGNYGSQSAIFTAKNLLGWRNEETVDVTGSLDMNKLLDRIMDNSEDFVDEKEKENPEDFVAA